MESSPTKNVNPHADFALSTYMEQFSAGGRVLWMGDASSVGSSRLATSAHTIDILDSQATTKETTSKGKLRIHAMTEDLSGFQQAGFDVVVVSRSEYLGKNYESQLVTLKSLLWENGVLAIGVTEANESQIRNIVEKHFNSVQRLTQTPFSGYLLGDPDSRESRIDGSFSGSRSKAERILLFCANEAASSDHNMVVEVPRDHESSPNGKSRAQPHEIERLEQLLLERAQELLETKKEIKRRGELIRDVSKRFAELEPLSTDNGDGSTQNSKKTLVRALEAEAERAQAYFVVDELRTELATLEERIQDLETNGASLMGRERGLRSRIAESDELRSSIEARFQLVQTDLDIAKTRQKQLEREISEAHEHLELQMMRAREPERELRRVETKLDSILGEKNGLEARLFDTEAALAAQLERLTQIGDKAMRESERVKEFAAAAAIREALVMRLQLDLAEDEQVARGAREKLQRLSEENQALRQALMEASGATDERDRYKRKLEALEQERSSVIPREPSREGQRSTVDSLREIRSTLVTLSQDISPSTQSPQREITAVGTLLEED